MSIPKTESVMSILDSADVAVADRQKLLCTALARVVAYSLPIPTEAVENAYDFFSATYSDQVSREACKINEHCIIDIDAVVDLTQRIWLFRYRLVHDGSNSTVRQFLDAMIRVGTREVPPNVSELLVQENSELLEAVASRLRDCLTGKE